MYWNLDDKERFFTALELAAENKKLLRNFLGEFFTTKEIEAFALRPKVRCLVKDSATYKNIQMLTKLSPTTVSRLTKLVKDRECAIQQVIKKFTRNNKPAYFD